MNWDTISGQWKELKGKVRERWGRLTDDDLEQIGGKKDQLVGKLQKHYGYAKDQAEREADEFCHSCDGASARTGDTVKAGAQKVGDAMKDLGDKIGR